MTILFDATLPVKPARPSRRFGAGLLRSLPVYRADHSASDEAWWATELARSESAHIDRRAAVSACLDMAERGISCC